MKTFIIFNRSLEEPLSFFIVQGDYSHLDDLVLGSSDPELEQEGYNLLYDKNGYLKHTTYVKEDWLNEFLEHQEDSYVIIISEIP